MNERAQQHKGRDIAWKVGKFHVVLSLFLHTRLSVCLFHCYASAEDPEELRSEKCEMRRRRLPSTPHNTLTNPYRFSHSTPPATPSKNKKKSQQQHEKKMCSEKHNIATFKVEKKLCSLLFPFSLFTVILSMSRTFFFLNQGIGRTTWRINSIKISNKMKSSK